MGWFETLGKGLDSARLDREQLKRLAGSKTENYYDIEAPDPYWLEQSGAAPDPRPKKLVEISNTDKVKGITKDVATGAVNGKLNIPTSAMDLASLLKNFGGKIGLSVFVLSLSEIVYDNLKDPIQKLSPYEAREMLGELDGIILGMQQKLSEIIKQDEMNGVPFERDYKNRALDTPNDRVAWLAYRSIATQLDGQIAAYKIWLRKLIALKPLLAKRALDPIEA